MNFVVNTKERKSGLAVLMSVYYKDEPVWLDKAISSIIDQTRRPDEIVLVKDGALTQPLDSVIKKWTEKCGDLIKVVPLERNSGLGPALMAGIEEVSYKIIARMDSDDISVPERFQKQFDFLAGNQDIDLVCSWAGQFKKKPDELIFCRKCPVEYDQIVRLAKFRNPIDHGTVMFRVSKVLTVGGYCDVKGFEDYHLWVRMMMNSSHMACIPEVLYKFRRGPEMLNRRRGLGYLRRWITLEKEFLNMGFVSLPIFLANVIMRSVVYLVPFGILRWFRALMRL